eukprot:2713-Heterococcus_DN1.PRE.4
MNNNRARAALSKKESSHSQLAGMYPTPAQWGSCSDSGTSSSSVVLHFEDAYSLWSFNVETCQADARLLGHLGTVNQLLPLKLATATVIDFLQHNTIAAASCSRKCYRKHIGTASVHYTAAGADCHLHTLALQSSSGTTTGVNGCNKARADCQC